MHSGYGRIESKALGKKTESGRNHEVTNGLARSEAIQSKMFIVALTGIEPVF
jgi:hypothetical protein